MTSPLRLCGRGDDSAGQPIVVTIGEAEFAQNLARMLSGNRGRCARCSWCASESRRWTRVAKNTGDRVLQRSKQLVVFDLRVFMQFSQPTGARERYVFSGKAFGSLGH